MKKTSVMHRDIGDHKHDITIFNSYETYAVCMKCGMHDWSAPQGYKGDFSLMPHFLDKYPSAKIDNTIL